MVIDPSRDFTADYDGASLARIGLGSPACVRFRAAASGSELRGSSQLVGCVRHRFGAAPKTGLNAHWEERSSMNIPQIMHARLRPWLGK